MHSSIGLLARSPQAQKPRFAPKRRVLRVAAFAGFAPFAWSENGRPKGRDLAFLQRFATAEGLTLQVDFFGFDRLWEQPARGAADMAASGISLLSRTGRGNVAWTRPYANVRRTLLIRTEDRGRFRGWADFAHARVAVVPGSAADSHARATRPSSAELTSCETLELGIEALLDGTVDAVGAGDISARHHLAAQADRLAMVDVHGGAPPEYVAFAVRRGHPLLQRLNAFIRRAAALY